MSGTSLDGLDICRVRFSESGNGWQYVIDAAETIRYPDQWLVKLRSAENCTGVELVRLHTEYGKFTGEMVRAFLGKFPGEQPAFVASHGHTIFHRPDLGYTFQLGAGSSIAAACRLPVVCDFRTTDVALGGQGAPLVPVGDELLFGNFHSCLNLGGFANISYSENGRRIAFDICAVNYVLNRLAKRAGKMYDADGAMAANGNVLPDLLERLNALPYYRAAPPKSLGREWAESSIFPLLKSEYRIDDLLRTFTLHVAEQIGAAAPAGGRMLVTGGGAHNGFLVRLLKEKCNAEVVVPDPMTVDFKEALVFAFLGLLRWNSRVNVLSSVTGAGRDSSSGAIYFF